MAKFFVFWSFLFCFVFRFLLPVVVFRDSFHPEWFFSGLFMGSYHLWFIFMIVGLYLLLPLLRLWVTRDNVRYVRYFVLLSLVFSFTLPSVAEIGSLFSGPVSEISSYIGARLKNFHLDYLGGFTTYFLLGWYLRFFDVNRKKLLYALGIVSTAVIFAATSVLSVHFNKYVNMHGTTTLLEGFQTIAIFLFVKERCSRPGILPSKMIRTVSKYSLGIYAMHAGALNIAQPALTRLGITNAYLVIPILFLSTFFAAFCASLLFGKVHYLRQFVE